VKKIALTGGIGSGKTVVAQILQHAGYRVYIADIRAKLLMRTDKNIRDKIISLLGEDAYNGNELNKKYIGQKIFSDDSLRIGMNNIVHPAVRNDFSLWCNKTNSTVVFYESALIFETGSQKNFDKVVLVVASEHKKIERVSQRDGISHAEVKSKISAQMSDIEKSERADFIIHNSGDKLVLEQVNTLLTTLLL